MKEFKDMKREIQEKVLEEIIQMMEAEEGEGLKKHSPKFMKVETNDPEMVEEVLEKVESSEVSEDPEKKSDEDEDEKRLRELYSKLK